MKFNIVRVIALPALLLLGGCPDGGASSQTTVIQETKVCNNISVTVTGPNSPIVCSTKQNVRVITEQ